MARHVLRNRVRPLVALSAMRRLLANPEATGEVFRIIEALRGDSLGGALARLRQSPSGRDLLLARPDMAAILSDRDRLRAMPAGSLGRAYLEFVERQQLSADGLVAASSEAPPRQDLSEEECWLGERLRDIHDLQHVLTGYGRDPLGELCLLAFMDGQTANRGIRFIVFMGRRKFRRECPQQDIDGCVAEGRALARAAEWLPALPLDEYLPLPLAALRERWQLGKPTRYLATRRELDALSAAPGGAGLLGG